LLDRKIGTRVDLSLLSEAIVQFFESKGFSSAIDQSSKGYRVIAAPGAMSNIPRSVNVLIRGKPEDFEIEFDAGSNSRTARVLGPLATILGGGFLVLKDLKSQEYFDKLEKEFWLFVDEKTENLRGPSSEK